MTDAENQTTAYTYDTLNRRLTIQWPDHVAGSTSGDQHYGIQATAYDAAGRALRKTDQRGDTISLIYDLAGRMLRREYRSLANSTPLEDGLPTEPVADQDVFTYDAASRMLTATKGRYSNTVAFTYDAGGRRATESLAVSSMGFQPVQYSISYAYDAAGRESQLTYPDGTVVQRTFTARSQLETVSLTEPGSNTAQSISTFEYDAGRRETSRTYGNGITTTRTYRADNLVTAITAPSVESLTYTYDVNKNPTSESRSGVMAPYSWATDINGASGFDAQNRLTNWTRSNGESQSWQLSAVNDWQTFTNNGVPQQRTHGPTHEIASIDNSPLQHDSRGNLTQDNRGTSMTYDADNMLAVFNANGTEGLRNATYTYDALGRRISKTVAGATSNDPATTTLFVLANQQVIAEYQSTGTQQPTLASRTAYGTYVDEPLILLSTLTFQTAYYHANRQYSIYNLTDATGSVLDRIAYTPYGEHYCFTPAGAPRSNISEAGNATLYTGRVADAESGLHYFRARYFAEKLGGFLSHDPDGYPDGSNAFAAYFSYSFSTDPTGHRVWCRGAGFSFVFTMGGGLSVEYCTDDCGNWAYVLGMTARIGLGASVGAVTEIYSGDLAGYINGSTLDIDFSGGPLGPFNVGGNVGIGGSGSGVHGGVGGGVGITAGWNPSQMLSGDLSHRCPLPPCYYGPSQGCGGSSTNGCYNPGL